MATLGQRSKIIMLWSLHKGIGWKTQYERTERWYQRLKKAETKEDVLDFVFTFFQNCFYLREWMELTCGLPKSDLEELFSNHVELRICRDICNVTKHFSISRSSQEYEISIIREYCNPNSPYFRDCYFGGDARLTVVTDKKNYDAIELAFKCICIWREFLTSKGLFVN